MNPTFRKAGGGGVRDFSRHSLKFSGNKRKKWTSLLQITSAREVIIPLWSSARMPVAEAPAQVIHQPQIYGLLGSPCIKSPLQLTQDNAI